MSKAKKVLELDVDDLTENETASAVEQDAGPLIGQYAFAKRQLDQVEHDYKTAQEMAKAELSDAVKAIFDAFGSGPFEILGETVTITSRAYPSEVEGVEPRTVWFLKRMGRAVKKLG